MKKVLIGMLGVALAAPVLALSHSAKVVMAGVENGGTVYISPDVNPNNCLNGGIYFFAASSNTKEALAVALTARATGRNVRIDYNKNNTTGLCTGYAVYLQ